MPPRKTPRATFLFVHPTGSLPGVGYSIKSSRVRRRIRNATVQMHSLELAYLAEAHQDFRSTGIPAPSGVEFPHRRGTSRCDPEHAVWQGYEEARSEASERASIETEGLDDGAFVAAVRDILSKHRQWQSWLIAATKCAREFEDRQERRKPKGIGQQWERAQIRRRAKLSPKDDERDFFEGDYVSEMIEGTADRFKPKKKLPRALRGKAPPRRRRA